MECINLYSQSKWEYIGVFNDKDIYYDKTSVTKGRYNYVLVMGKPKNFAKDDLGKDFKYVTVKCVFYDNVMNQVRCVISDRIYYYEDNSYRKSAFPKIDVALTYDRIINDLYNKIR